MITIECRVIFVLAVLFSKRAIHYYGVSSYHALVFFLTSSICDNFVQHIVVLCFWFSLIWILKKKNEKQNKVYKWDAIAILR